MVISVKEALDIIYATAKPLAHEIVPIEESVGRIAYRDYTTRFSLPRFDNSAMDGYAVKLSQAGKTLPCNHVIYAGDRVDISCRDGAVIKIMTGAPIPQNAEAIIPKELTRETAQGITLPEEIAPGAHIRRAGEDMAKGTTYLRQDDAITPYTPALLSSQGVTHVDTYRRPEIAIFSTGEELRCHHETIEEHQLYNSNTPMLLARAKSLGCDSHFVGSATDTIEGIQEMIEASLHADIIITSGGVSVGDRDYTKEAFTSLGLVTHFSGIEIKPGKPTTFGTIGSSYVVNLPGNPLAAMANFELFVRPLIAALQGRSGRYHGSIITQIDHTREFRGGRTSIVLGRYNGRCFTPLPLQLPGMVSPIHEAEAMVILGADITRLEPQDELIMLPITCVRHSTEREAIITTRLTK